uniref:Photosystem II 10 kDa protein n=1 Tax=Euglena hiemalis TaxID=392896 RepID=A0A345UC67_9EUGL|nr:photosystem II 10 kDa protein [Euglena hiemalis]AXI98053.1 photosystem II 10 kDa protein [Euglena hiemalis]
METISKNKISSSKGKITPLGTILKPLNADYGRVDTEWGYVGIMLTFMVLFAIFLTIILEIYNSSIILNS